MHHRRQFAAHRTQLLVGRELSTCRGSIGGHRFTGVERRRLARKPFALGRKALKELQTLVTPDTLLRCTGVGPAGRAR
jgi:hypothetical protein